MKNFLKQNKLILQFLSLATFAGITVGISQIAVNLYAINLGANSSWLGLIGGLPGLGVILIVLPMGFLVDRFGARKMFIIGAASGVLIYLVLPSANTPLLLLLLMMLSGFFISFRFVSMNSVFLDYLKENGNAKAGWFRGSHSIGMAFLGPLLGSYLIKQINFHWTFYTISFLLVITIIIAWFVLKDGKEDKSITIFSFSQAFGHIKSLIRNKELVEASLAESLAIMTFSVFNVFMIAIALRVFHFPKEVAALFISVQGALYILSVFSLDILLRRIGQRNFYLVSTSSIILSLLLLGGAREPIGLWIGTIFLGTGLGMLNIINISRLARIDGKKGRVSGFFSLFTWSGGIIGPLLGGFIGSVFGLQAIFFFLVPLFLVFWIKIFFEPKVLITKSLLIKLLKKVKEKSIGIILPILLFIFWEISTRMELFSSQLLVPPKQVLLAFQDLLREGELLNHLEISLLRVLSGFIIGAASGFLLGTVLGTSKQIEKYVAPIFNSFRQIPLMGWMPLLMLWLGVEETFKIVFISFGAFYALTLNTFEGIKNVPKEYVEVAKVFEYSRLKLLRKVVLPSALPSIFTGIKLGLSMSWMLVVGAEFVAASEGIGYLMTWGRQLFQFDIVILGVIIIGIVGLIMNQVLGIFETRFLSWRKTFNTIES
jgi:sulfonate transport system permease protein